MKDNTDDTLQPENERSKKPSFPRTRQHMPIAISLARPETGSRPQADTSTTYAGEGYGISLVSVSVNPRE